jgi:rubrerythrin
MAQTDDDLQEAFGGESRANRKYLAYARKAAKEGYPQVARVFRAAADSETVHAMNHMDVMGMVDETAENLRDAAEGEAAEFEEMYPEFIEHAEQAGRQAARDSFDFARQVEKVHHRMYERALESVQNGEDLSESAIWVCQGCGNVFEGDPPDSCPICGAPRSMFKQID